jgi:hypothetical protein
MKAQTPRFALVLARRCRGVCTHLSGTSEWTTLLLMKRGEYKRGAVSRR